MNLNAKSFDICNARICARASADAYHTETLCDTLTDTHCLVIDDADCIVVAFKGTTSIRNWMTDVDCRRAMLFATSDEVGFVHDGFQDALDGVIIKLKRELGNYADCKPIFLTGHSLGGALAQLGAYALDAFGYPIAQIYTFGQPRVGNGAFKTRYNALLGSKTFRMVYQEDIVARFPHLPAWHDPYRHAGNEVFISSVTEAKTPDDFWFNPPLWRLLISDAWGIYRSWLIRKFAAALDPAFDHHINNYVNALSAVTDPAKTVNPQTIP